MTFTDKKKRAKRILKDTMPGGTITIQEIEFDYLLDFFELHPNWEEKSKHGVYGFQKLKQGQWGNNYSFFVLGRNGNKTSISTSFAKSGNNIDNIKRAFRTAIRPQIEEKKALFEPGTPCEISGESIKSIEDLHIDHHNLDFKDVLNTFLDSRGIRLADVQYQKNNTMYYLSDDSLERDFQEYHRHNTTLRFTHKYYNLRK